MSGSEAYDLNNPALLESTILQILTPTTALIREAEQRLRPFLRQPGAIAALLQQVTGSSNEAVRHVAAVLLRQKISTHWGLLSEEEKNAVKASLLTLMGSEASRPVRVALAGVTSKVASAENDAEWPELMSMVESGTTNPSADVRDMCYTLIFHCVRLFADATPIHPALAETLRQAINDESPRVQSSAVTALAELFKCLFSEEEALQVFLPLLPEVLSKVQTCVENGEEDVAGRVLEMFGDLFGSQAECVDECVTHVVPFVTVIATTSDISVQLRDLATWVISVAAEFRPRHLGKCGMVPNLLNSLLGIIVAHPGSIAGSFFQMHMPLEHIDESEDDYKMMSSLAVALDSLVRSVPHKYVFQPTLALIGECFNSENPLAQRAGLAFLGNSVEGMRHDISAMISEILPPILALTAKPDRELRQCGCFCLGQFAEHCRPYISRVSGDIFELAAGLLEPDDHAVQGLACYVIEMLAEELQPEHIAPYVEVLLMRLLPMLNAEHIVLREMSVAALASICVAAEADFMPHLQGLLPAIMPMLFLTADDSLRLRGRAIEFMGYAMVAVGSDTLAPFMDDIMTSVHQSLQLEDNQMMQDFVFAFLANCARGIGVRFAPYVDRFLPYLCEYTARADAKQVSLSAFNGEDTTMQAFMDQEDEAADTSNDMMTINFDPATVDTKKAALMAIGSICRYTEGAVLSHTEAIVDAVRAVSASWSPQLRGESIEALGYLVQGVASGLNVAEPEDGVVIEVPSDAHSLINFAMEVFISTLEEDVEKEPCAAACVGLAAVCRSLGLGGLQLLDAGAGLQRLQIALKQILEEKAPCQVYMEEEREEDEQQHDSVLIDEAADLIGSGLSSAFGTAYPAFFNEFVEPLMRYSQPVRAFTDRMLMPGVLAEVFEHIGDETGHYGDLVRQMAEVGLVDEYHGVRRNTAYMVATFVTYAGQAGQPFYPRLLELLAPLIQRQDMIEQAHTDNALSAVARMMVAGEESFPFDVVLPAYVGCLPLQEDKSEGIHVYSAVLRLVREKHPSIMPFFPQLLEVFRAVLDPLSGEHPETRQLVEEVLLFCATGADAELKTAFDTAMTGADAGVRDFLSAGLANLAAQI